MHKLFRLLTCFVIGFVLSGQASAAEFGSKEEAKAMTEHAAAFVKSQGQDKAFAAFNAGSDGFKDRDLYVFVYNKDGVCLSHGANSAMIGKPLIGLKDADGKELIKEIVSVPATGWVDFKWRNPTTQEIMKKHAYVIHDGDFWFGVGAYEK
jgi:cytochrome c